MFLLHISLACSSTSSSPVRRKDLHNSLTVHLHINLIFLLFTYSLSPVSISSHIEVGIQLLFASLLDWDCWRYWSHHMCWISLIFIYFNLKIGSCGLAEFYLLIASVLGTMLFCHILRYICIVHIVLLDLLR